MMSDFFAIRNFRIETGLFKVPVIIRSVLGIHGGIGGKLRAGPADFRFISRGILAGSGARQVCKIRRPG